MAYTVLINKQPVTIFNLSITETIDQTLDYGVMELRSDKAESYNVGDYVKITFDGKDYDFIIEADVVMRMNEDVYRHRISLIELTKRLENYTDTRRKFTQPSDPQEKKTLYDIAELLRLTIPIETEDSLNLTRLFNFSQNVITRLSAVEAPEFQFENKNLREMLNDVFEFANGIPRLKIVYQNVFRDEFVLDGDFYNELRNEIPGFENTFADQKQININESASSLDAEIANQVGTVVYEPTKNSYDFKKLMSPGGLLDTDSAVMETDFGIVELQKVEINAIYTDINDVRAKRPVDVTKFILEKTEYDLIPTNVGLFENRWTNANYINPDEGFDKLLTKSNTGFFTRYQKNIGNLYEPYGFFIFAITNMRQMVTDAIVYNSFLTDNPTNLNLPAYANIALEKMNLDNSQLDFDTLEFRIEYIPYYNSRNVIRKSGLEKTYREMSRYFGQSDKITSPVRAIKKLFKTVQQMGNDQIQTSSRVTNYELGDWIQGEDGNKYFLVTKETFFNPNRTTAKYLWTKNYQQISQYIGMNAEPRIFEIPLESYKRNIVIENFVELSDVEKENDSFFEDSLVERFMRTFNRFGNNQTGISVASFNNPYLYNSLESALGRQILDDYYVYNPDTDTIVKELQSYQDGRIIKSLAKSGSGNTLSFYFEFNNPKAASGRQNNQFSKTIMDLIPYTKPDGTLDKYSFQLVDNFILAHPANYPIIKKFQSYTDSSGQRQVIQLIPDSFNSDEKRFVVHLDSAEILAQTFQLHIVPEKDKESKFIVGKFLVEHNNLTNPLVTQDGDFVVVARNKPYSWTDEYDLDSDIIENATVAILGNKALRAADITGYTAWAWIYKPTRQIVFAVNDINQKEVFFNFRNKRTGFIYEYLYPFYEGYVPVLTPFQLFQLTLSQTSIYFAWQYYQGVTVDNFVVEISSDEENWTTYTTNNFTFTFEDLQPGTDYTLRVKAIVDGNESNYATVYSKTLEGKPIAPSNLTATAYSQTSIELNWDDNSNNEYAFVVRYSQSSDMSNFTSVNVPANRESRLITSLQTGITYYFNIRAIGNAGFSDFSNQASSQTLPPEKIATPSISGLSANTDSVTFTVTNNFDEFVDIKANITINPPSTTITGINGLAPGATFTHTISGLSQGTNYVLYVRAEKAGFTVSDTAQQSFTTQTVVTRPPAPDSIFFPAEYLMDTSARVQWTQVPEANGYRGELFNLTSGEPGVGFVKGSNFVVLHDYTENQLIPGNQYRARVWSTKDDGQGGTVESLTFVEGTFTTTVTVAYPAAPSNVQIARSGNNNTITWQDNSNNEDGFTVSYAFQQSGFPAPETSDFFPIHDTQAPNVTSYIHNAPSFGAGTFWYRIYSYNENGNSTTFAQASLFVSS